MLYILNISLKAKFIVKAIIMFNTNFRIFLAALKQLHNFTANTNKIIIADHYFQAKNTFYFSELL